MKKIKITTELIIREKDNNKKELRKRKRNLKLLKRDMKVKKIKENHKISMQSKSKKKEAIKDKMFERIKKIKGIKTNIKSANREETMLNMKRKKLDDKRVKLTDN